MLVVARLVLCGVSFGQKTRTLINTTWEGSRTASDRSGHVQKRKPVGTWTLALEDTAGCRIEVDGQSYICTWKTTARGLSVERPGPEGSHWVERFDLATDGRTMYGTSTATGHRPLITRQETFVYNLARVESPK